MLLLALVLQLLHSSSNSVAGKMGRRARNETWQFQLQTDSFQGLIGYCTHNEHTAIDYIAVNAGLLPVQKFTTAAVGHCSRRRSFKEIRLVAGKEGSPCIEEEADNKEEQQVRLIVWRERRGRGRRIEARRAQKGQSGQCALSWPNSLQILANIDTLRQRCKCEKGARS